MNPQVVLEGIGYVSSVLILVSLLMSSVVKFRVINAIGSLIFTVYAILIQSYPTAVLNFCLVAVDVWFLVKVLRQKICFSVVSASARDQAAVHFFRFYENDIRRTFPDVNMETCSRVCLVYADANPVGLLAGDLKDGVLQVELDYSCPAYRDCSVGHFLYGYLKVEGVRTLVAHSGAEQHIRYLRKMGFVSRGDAFVKEL